MYLTIPADKLIIYFKSFHSFLFSNELLFWRVWLGFDLNIIISDPADIEVCWTLFRMALLKLKFTDFFSSKRCPIKTKDCFEQSKIHREVESVRFYEIMAERRSTDEFRWITQWNILLNPAFKRNFIFEWINLDAVGKKWHDRRKIITPAFHFNILERFVEIFDRLGNTVVEKLKTIPPDEPTEFYPIAVLYALDVMCGEYWKVE